MSFSALEQQLDHIEQQFDVVAAALVGTDPVEVQLSSAALQQLAVDFKQTVDELRRRGAAPAHLAKRLKVLADSMPALRSSLVRRTAYVEQALQLVIPATEKTTYGPTSGPTSGPYGNGVRQSGTFRAFSA